MRYKQLIDCGLRPVSADPESRGRCRQQGHEHHDQFGHVGLPQGRLITTVLPEAPLPRLFVRQSRRERLPRPYSLLSRRLQTVRRSGTRGVFSRIVCGDLIHGMKTRMDSIL
jgi:hypothetical protein